MASNFVKLTDLPYTGKCCGLYRPAQVGSTIIEWDNWIYDVLLNPDR